MKRNLIKGIVLISAVALSSCSSTKLAGLKNEAYNDDVYYSRAKAGDAQQYMADASQQSNNYVADDAYYYYGDYASRLNRFSGYSPFDYTDNFYYNYVPYNNGFGAGLDYSPNYYDYNYGSSNPIANNTSPYIDNGYVYSPYDYGYSPFYDMGYDDYGYGDIYSAFVIGGGGGGGYSGYGHFSFKKSNPGVTVPGTNPLARGVRTTSSPGVTRIASSMPGRPAVSVNTKTGVVTRTNLINVAGNNTASRQPRESFTQQQQNIAPRSISTSTPAAASSSSSSSAASSGGGGRPARP